MYNRDTLGLLLKELLILFLLLLQAFLYHLPLFILPFQEFFQAQ